MHVEDLFLREARVLLGERFPTSLLLSELPNFLLVLLTQDREVAMSFLVLLRVLNVAAGVSEAQLQEDVDHAYLRCNVELLRRLGLVTVTGNQRLFGPDPHGVVEVVDVARAG